MKRRILISGGSRGIGAALVKKFALSGDTVSFIYKSSHDAARVLSSATGATAICADLASPNGCRDAVSRAAELMGGIDILINNAGISRFNLFTEISDGEWEEMISVNLSAPFYCTREAARLMIHNKSGKIINISSMWGITGASCEVHYSAAKAGLIGMTKALAKEMGPSGITVNCICPGVIETDMNAHLSDSDISALCDETPLCRIGKPEEVADLAYFLASDSADFMTGQIISCDGGFAI